MRDDALVRFTAHEIPRDDLHALMTRSDGPALLRASRDGASDGLPDPLAQSGARDARRTPGFLALPELSRVPLGPSPLHARPGPGSRALLPEACLPAHVPLSVDRDSKCQSSRRGYFEARFRPGGPTLDGAL